MGYEFVRNFGVVRPTPGGGLHPWSGEDYYCDASSALTFGRSPTKNARIHLIPRYRRLLTNGVIGRIEVAFQVSNRFGVDDIVQVVAGFPVRVRRSTVEPLRRAGLSAARLYLQSTTSVAMRDTVGSPSVVVPGAPLILVERRGIRGDGLGTIMEDPETGVLLEHLWSKGADPAQWAISHGPATKPEAIRHVRVHALRLHCELDAFITVLRACLTGQLKPGKSERLRDYLYESSKAILRPKFDSLPQRGLLARMASAYAAQRPDLIASISAAFENVRPSLTRLVTEAVNVGQSGVAPAAVPISYFNIINTDGGKIVVGSNNVENSNNIEIGENAQVRGAVGHDIDIKGSTFGDVSQGGDDLVALIGQLIRELEGAGTRLNGGTVQVELARLAESEAKAENPSKSKIRTLVSGISDGIRGIGEVASPIIKTIEAIMDLVH